MNSNKLEDIQFDFEQIFLDIYRYKLFILLIPVLTIIICLSNFLNYKPIYTGSFYVSPLSTLSNEYRAFVNSNDYFNFFTETFYQIDSIPDQEKINFYKQHNNDENTSVKEFYFQILNNSEFDSKDSKIFVRHHDKKIVLAFVEFLIEHANRSTKKVVAGSIDLQIKENKIKADMLNKIDTTLKNMDVSSADYEVFNFLFESLTKSIELNKEALNGLSINIKLDDMFVGANYNINQIKLEKSSWDFIMRLILPFVIILFVSIFFTLIFIKMKKLLSNKKS